MDEKLLTYPEVAQRYGLKIGTLYALVAKNKIPHSRISPKMVRFDPVRLDAWFKAKEVPYVEDDKR